MLSNPRQIQFPQQRNSPNAISLVGPTFTYQLPRGYHLILPRQQHSDNIPTSLSTEANLREASHTHCCSLESFLTYSEYCIASEVDSCCFVEYILGLKTIKTCIHH